MIVKPFKALRPVPSLAKEVSSLPYDVMNVEEARDMARGNENSFLHIIRSEIDLAEDIDVHTEPVYRKAKENLDAFIQKGILVEDKKPHFYIYAETMQNRTQTGIVALTSVDEYKQGKIKKHEFTLPQKEEDRIQNFLFCQAHTEPVFFINKKNEKLSELIRGYTAEHPAVYDFVSEDGNGHKLWVVEEDAVNREIEEIFAKMDALYIADGHHRTNSSCRVGERLKKENPESNNPAYEYIMAVIFSEDELYVMDYNRLLKDIGGYSVEEFVNALREDFIVEEKGDCMYKASCKHNFSMYMNGIWYSLTVREHTYDENDPVESLDASILQKNVFDKLLSIKDPRTSDRLEFVGGIRGYGELQKRVDEKNCAAAFGVYSVSIRDLISVADNNLTMPPKSTWFEPKLRSGLFIHKF